LNPVVHYVLNVYLRVINTAVDNKTDIKMFSDDGNVFVNYLQMISAE
jgi:hypothetical protein